MTTSRNHRGRGRNGRRGFTLTELIVAVGVTLVLLLAVGRIFSMSRDTISIGEASAEIGHHARALERQLREDFQAMTREGFLVIRNERLGLGAKSRANFREPKDGPFLNADQEEAGVALTSSANPTLRLDQLLFFATGSFPSYQYDQLGVMRGEISRNTVAPAARIWYGHGLRLPTAIPAEMSDPDDRDDWDHWEIRDFEGRTRFPIRYRARFADVSGSDDADLVNRYAQDWILARQAAGLLPRTAANASDYPRVGNDPRRLFFAPTVIDLFNEQSSYFHQRYFFPVDGLWGMNDPRSAARRRLSTGYVDLIDQTLIDVEKMITEYGVQRVRSQPPNPPLEWGTVEYGADPLGRSGVSIFSEYPAGLWTNDALVNLDDPVFTYANENNLGRFSAQDAQAIGDDVAEKWMDGQRVRMMLAPTRIRVESAPPSANRLDQMLTHATFIPAVSHFEVAWSTGQPQYPSGQIAWYDIENPANPYLNRPGMTREEIEAQAPEDPRIWYLSELTPERLGNSNWPNIERDQWQDLYYATFGYFVPKVRRRVPNGSGGDEYVDDRSEPWPWPRLIRIRVRLHDSSGRIPSGREFEWIFEVPQGAAAG